MQTRNRFLELFLQEVEKRSNNSMGAL
jgi:hypothetical protein